MKKIFLNISLLMSCVFALRAQSPTTAFDVAGIKVIFKPTVKEVLSVRVFFRGGVNNFKPEEAGIERFALSGLLECGTKKYEANQYKAIEDQFGIEIGASADYDFSDVNMVCVSKYFNEGWDLLVEAIKNPVYDKTEVELLRSKILNAVKQEGSDPDKRIEQMAIENGFKGTAYGTDPNGSEQVINSLTADQLKDYYRTLLNKNKMFIVVAGKITKEQLVEKIQNSFAELPAMPYQPVVNTPPVWDDNRLLTEGRQLATNYINAIMNAPVMSSPDYVPYRMGISALSGALFSEIRTKRNLSYDPGAYTTASLMPYSIMEVSTTKPKETIKLMVGELNWIKKNGISVAGLTEMKSGYITSNYIKVQSSNALTQSLGTAEIMGDWHYFDYMPQAIDAVTTQQIYDAINRYITGVRWDYLGDPGLAKDAKDAFSEKIK